MFSSLKRKRVQTIIEGTSRTKQAHKDECDINNILRKYQKTGMISHVNKIKGKYGDFSNITNYQDAYLAIEQAHENFMGLPASIREKFQNDPSQLLEFVQDSKNYDEAVKIGIIEKKAQIEPEIKNPAAGIGMQANDAKTTN